MLDLTRLKSIRLRARPLGQRLFAAAILTPNYRFPLSRTRIEIEGIENIRPGGGAILVMNHTDKYNYWPFQYELWRRDLGFTATWVKGKYYEKPITASFLDAMNNIPMPSKGYVITKDFQSAMGRLPSNTEYTELKKLLDGAGDGKGLEEFLKRGGSDEPYAASVERRFSAMMERVMELNREALSIGLNLLIFPQGTRSLRLTRGHTGAAQVALHLRAPVIPIGCNGSNLCYPGNNPLSRGGRIVYRVGAPLTHDAELKSCEVGQKFVPFTDSAEPHQERFRAATDLMMERIDSLLDPEYRFADDSHLTRGAKRFL